MSLSYSMVNKRFDFAVPLEDIFTNGGIHPRLKFIFEQAFELYLRSHLNIKQTLQEKCCLSQCLELKKTIIYANQPAIHSQYSTPSDFFWIIRHFLGLMPISLLPTATSNQKFPWKELSKQCIPFLQCELREEECNFHCLIARSLNNLPLEHITLLNTLVIFIREISKNNKLRKVTLKNLAQYYCDAVFLRPYQPGHKIEDQTMLPLFIFIITRWYRIVKYLRIDVDIVLEADTNCIVNSSSQTSRFISEFRDVPCKIVKYLKDVECQTDTTDESKVNVSFTTSKLLTNGLDKSVQPVDSFIKDEDVSLKTFTAHLNKRKAPSFVSSLVNINENEENIECQKCQQLNFFDNVINDRNNNWNEVVQEIARTVTRVEGHNYETEYFQSSDNFRSATSELSESTFESGTVDTIYDTFKDSTLNGTKTEDSQNTFSFKSIEHKNKYDAKTRCQKNDESISFYKSFYKSDEELYNINGEKSNDFEEDDNNNLSNFSLKRFKMKFNFLRTFPPKFKRSNNFRCILAKNIKYKKIQN